MDKYEEEEEEELPILEPKRSTSKWSQIGKNRLLITSDSAIKPRKRTSMFAYTHSPYTSLKAVILN